MHPVACPSAEHTCRAPDTGSAARAERRGRSRRRHGLALAAAGGCFLAVSLGPTDAGARAACLGGTDPSCATAAIDHRQTRVQPRAREFAQPDGEADLSPEAAREVDQLYDKLMAETRTDSCRQRSPGSAKAARC